MKIREAVTSRPWMAGLLVVVGAAVALLGSRIVGAEPVRGEVAGFHQKAETERTSYADGEPVRMTFTVCRTRPWPTTTSSGNRTLLRYEWRILDADGRVVADTDHRFGTSDLLRAFWWPGQCRAAQDEWDQRYWNREDRRQDVLGTPVRGDQVPPGEYRFEVRWQTAPWDNPPVPQAPVETDPFRLEP